MEYLMILFLNNWPIEVEKFKTLEECQEKVKTYNNAAIQSGSSYKVWCEKRKL